ncbi:MAG TPA: prenyltransferase/squalene oxidase repeat-containing protein [Thermomicrobiales bacterium]|nr:prenyltransferase/squalene oxidase repeat-containing protein [Thermomicrobiales bacterium]
MKNKGLVRAIAIIVLALAMTVPAAAQDATPASATGSNLETATGWLMDQQLEDGAFAGFSGDADAGTTVDAMFALVSARDAGIDTGTSIEDALGYLASGDVALVYQQIGVGQAAKLALALIAAGEDPADFAKTAPILIVQHGQDADTGMYGSQLYDHAYAMLALVAHDDEIPSSSFDVLTSTQAANGGWAFDGSTDEASADSNTTAMIVQALVASGNGEHETMAGALEFLASTVTESGAAYAPGAEADGNSTALVLQAMIATGGDTSGLQAALATFQNENGSFFYQAADTSDNLFTTVQAIPAAAGDVLPIVPTGEATPVAATWQIAA